MAPWLERLQAYYYNPDLDIFSSPFWLNILELFNEVS